MSITLLRKKLDEIFHHQYRDCALYDNETTVDELNRIESQMEEEPGSINFEFWLNEFLPLLFGCCEQWKEAHMSPMSPKQKEWIERLIQ